MRMNNKGRGIKRNFDEKVIREFILGLPFELTKDQEETIEVIKGELLSDKRMNRLVQGDVGSGKTIVAFIAGYMNYLGGYQTALMVPTEILANQHYKTARELFEGMGIKIGLLTSSVSFGKRKEVLKGIKEGEIDFVIGTQSLIQESVVYKRLGLVITDEQHRFGVKQREILSKKGIYPDILAMSATPIPRTYALTIYGDMDVSNIKTKPKGRLEVITYFKLEKEMLEVLKLMKGEIDLGHQIYVIAPMIEDNNGAQLGNVKKLAEKMKLAFGKIAEVGIVHGHMDSDEKNRVMEDFERGDIKILISTTVIEVGVNVVNASMMVVMDANMFGLSTLHQLRGRVGRGKVQGYCILVSKEENERLRILEGCSDGFVISEYDFKMRGEGDLFGIKQSGDAGFRLADVRRDYDLLIRVKKDVDDFFKNRVIKS